MIETIVVCAIILLCIGVVGRRIARQLKKFKHVEASHDCGGDCSNCSKETQRKRDHGGDTPLKEDL